MWRHVIVVIGLAACGRVGFDVAKTELADAADTRPNVVFVTSGTTPATFAAPPLASADGVCASRAVAKGLPGTFVAWLSTSTTDAIDRLAGSRGWVRVDGAPVADTAAEMIAGRIYNPINVDEAGQTVPSG